MLPIPLIRSAKVRAAVYYGIGWPLGVLAASVMLAQALILAWSLGAGLAWALGLV